MNEYVYKCPCCGSMPEKHEFFDKAIDRILLQKYEPVKIYFEICTDCGLVFQGIRMNDDDLHAYYAKHYRATIQGGNDGVTDRVLKEQSIRVEKLLEQLEVDPKHMLDVGSSTGLLMLAMKDKYGCEVLGIEPSEKFRMFAKNQHQLKSLSDLDLLHHEYTNKFDLITCIHTLEHFADPYRLLIRLHDYITPDGKLIIEVPDLFNEVTLRLAHPVSFCEASLRNILSLTGWEVIDLHNYNGMKTQPANILVTAKPGIVGSLVYVDSEQVRQNYRKGMDELQRQAAVPAE